jgi:hypothetical protein
MRLVHKRRRQLALVLSALGAFALGRACFVEIAEPEAVSTDAGLGSGGAAGADNSATGGTGGPSSGGSGGTGASGGSGATDGAAGASGCSAGQVACGSLGCFTTRNDLPYEPTDAQMDGGITWRMPRLAGDHAIEADFEDWAGIPLVVINDVCTSCSDQAPPGNIAGPSIVEFKTRPEAAELAAYFATGWTDAGIYVFVAVLDDEIHPPEGPDAGALSGEQVDGIELFLDGVITDFSPDGGEGFTPYAHHFLIGVNGAMFVPSVSDTPAPTDYVTARVRRSENCYVLEAKVAWGYLRPPPNPKAGDFLRFDVGVNDWDTTDGGLVERLYQVLWRDPGENYGNVTNKYPMLNLD